MTMIVTTIAGAEGHPATNEMKEITIPTVTMKDGQEDGMVIMKIILIPAEGAGMAGIMEAGR